MEDEDGVVCVGVEGVEIVDVEAVGEWLEAGKGVSEEDAAMRISCGSKLTST